MPHRRDADSFAHLFVCGCGHSGTTLIAKMLGRHRQIYAFPMETSCFERHGSIETAREYFRDFIYPLARQVDPVYVCEKTPRHIYYLEKARAAFPGCRFVVPVRDARDVALSIKLRYQSLARGYRRWNADNAVVRSALEAKDRDVIMFRYEDLIESTVETLEAICAHLQLPFDAAMLDYAADERRWSGRKGASGTPVEHEPAPSDHSNFRDWQVRQPLMDRRGRWKVNLEPVEIAEIERHCSELMRFFGYAPSRT